MAIFKVFLYNRRNLRAAIVYGELLRVTLRLHADAVTSVGIGSGMSVAFGCTVKLPDLAFFLLAPFFPFLLFFYFNLSTQHTSHNSQPGSSKSKRTRNGFCWNQFE